MRSPQDEILSVTFASITGVATEEQGKRLVQILETDAEARSLYFDLILLYTQLHRRNGLSIFIDKDTKPIIDQRLLSVLLEEERQAPALEPMDHLTCDMPQPASTQAPKINRLWPILALTSLAAMLILLVSAHIASHLRALPVATLYDSLQTQWQSPIETPNINDRLFTKGDPLTLQKGMIKLVFDNNARIVIEGPAQFQIKEANHLRLLSGQLYATIPQEAIGFLVSTPHSTVKDLGTEFGIFTARNGDTELHVTSGRTELFVGQTQTEGSLIVTEGDAKKIDTQTQTISNINLEAKAFIRDFNAAKHFIWYGENVDLEDIIRGGNGFGIDSYPHLMALSSSNTDKDYDIDIEVTDGYRPVAHPFIDGIFVPNGRQGPVQISTAGHFFTDCPVTSGKTWMKYIHVYYRKLGGVSMDSRTMLFDGQDYRQPYKRALILHASAGITFDLEALRNTLPDRTITHFTTRIGLPQSLHDDLRLKSRDLHELKAGFHILVDGNLRYQDENISVFNGPLPVDIPLSKHERFLTLVTTGNYGDNENFLWCLFAEPTLHLK